MTTIMWYLHDPPPPPTIYGPRSVSNELRERFAFLIIHYNIKRPSFIALLTACADETQFNLKRADFKYSLTVYGEIFKMMAISLASLPRDIQRRHSSSLAVKCGRFSPNNSL